MGRTQPKDVFLSYHRRDRERIDAIARWLLEKGKLSVFLDQWYLVPGQPWPQTLEAAMQSCRAVAVFVGAGELGPWQLREMNLALERQAREPGFPVIPVLLPGADPVLGFLGQNTWVDLRGASDDTVALSELVSAIRREWPDSETPGVRNVSRELVCPYRGLLHFREEDAPFFFGRDSVTEHLVTAVLRNGITAVVGPSGTGKSSVVRAGLVPMLRQSREKVWEICTIVPGDRPLRAIAFGFVPLLQPELTEVDLLVQVDTLARALAEGHVRLRDLVERLLIKQQGTQRVLLVIDQWEELYTLSHDSSARQRFIDLLLEAAALSPLSVVLTLRGDFVGEALASRALSDCMQGAQVNVGPMTAGELRRVLEGPARRVGLQFEPGLAERILQDTGDEPGHLPLLEFVLKRLWEMRDGSLLLHAAYDRMGKLEGAIASKAESVFAALSELEQQTVRRVFLQLARPGDGHVYTRRRATIAELPDFSASVVRTLADERLVVTGQVIGTAGSTVEVAHEALIDHWDRLRDWLNRDREFLLWRQRLRVLMLEWQRSDEPEAVLLHGSLLTEAERWRSERAEELTAAERRYVSLSSDLSAREIEERRRQREYELAQAKALTDAQRQIADEREARLKQQERSNINLRYALGFLSVGFVALLAAGGWAWHQTQVARGEAGRAQRILAAGNLREAAVRLNGGNLTEALPILASAVRLDPNSAATRATAIDALIRARWPLASFKYANTVNAVAISTDGNRVVIASDRTARVWDTRTGQPVGAPLAHEGDVNSVALSADDTRVVTGSDDETARLWDARTGQPLGVQLKHAGAVDSVEFSADGGCVVTVSRDRTARLWDARTGQPIGEPLRHEGKVNSAAFSADGRYVVTTSADETARVWDARTGRRVGAPLRHPDAVTSATFSADGALIVTTTDDERVARVWDLRTRRPLGGGPLKHAEVNSAAFSPDSKLVVTTSLDRTARVWNARTGQPYGPPLQHGYEVQSARFSGDGTRIVTASADKTARVWDARSGQLLGAPLAHLDFVSSAAFSADGTRVVTESGTTVSVWDARATQPVGTLLSEAGLPHRATFSADSERVVTVSGNTASEWVARTGQPTGHRLQYPGAVAWDAFSSDGRSVLTALGTTVHVWNPQTDEFLALPFHANVIGAHAEFSADGTRVVTAFGKTAQVWDARTTRALGSPMQNVDAITSVMFSADGTRLVTASSIAARVWDARTGQPVGLPLQTGGFLEAFSHDGTLLITRSEKTARLWNAQTGQAAGVPFQCVDGIDHVSFNADGTQVVTTCSTTAQVWDARTGQPVGARLKHSDFIISAAFSTDGTRVVTASTDHTARIWDARTGQQLGLPLHHPDDVMAAAFSPDGTRVVTISDMARLWEVPTGRPSEAGIIAEAAEAISEYMVNEAGGLVSTKDAGARIRSLQSRVATSKRGEATVASLLRWLFEDPWSRTVSPLSAITVPDYITERLKRCTSEARAEAESYYLGHPLFMRTKEFCPAGLVSQRTERSDR